MGSSYFTDRRPRDDYEAYPAEDGWPPVRGHVAAVAEAYRPAVPSARIPAPPVPPPGEFDPRSGPPSTPGTLRRIEAVAAQEQQYHASSGQGYVEPGYGYDDDYQDRYRTTGGYPGSGGGYSDYDAYPEYEDRIASRSWAATLSARDAGRTASADHAGGTVIESRAGAARAGGSRTAPGNRATPGGARPRVERAERPDGGQRAPGAHRAPAGRPGSARARLAIASTASLAGLSALVGTAVMATDTGSLTIKPGGGGTATGQWPTSESTDVASAGGGTMADGPRLTPTAPGGGTSSRQTTAPAPSETESPSTYGDLTSGVVYGDGGYVNAAGPLNPIVTSADPNSDPTTASTPDAAASTDASSPAGPANGIGTGTLTWLGIGDLDLGNIVGGASSGPSTSPDPSSSPDPSTSPDSSGTPSSTDSASPSGSATTPSGSDSSASSGSTPHASAAPSPSPSSSVTATSTTYRTTSSSADPFVVTSADHPANGHAVIGRFV
ncbi:hypothetical protein I6A60_20160 [Frankia sp. AgB1.9]|uniref:hypothetical protein n=1 Tax=unclassified Frankia TaxID=2632575 RepID=UPI0019344BCD|nr:MULTISPECIES: hypothetical protein [unclassified Frankia]MBL7489013.1 hypothetical protein [Frankia sp. AgW1.1]MBL7550178.1 hypothetical protein [Frankia sp. AgB1.9]MBL7618414.1 hypothetical protein [Frankia sp. AgB1.8]